MVQQFQTSCSVCSGEGTIFREKDRCKKCKGQKVIDERKVLEVHIEKGMKHEQAIRFEGEANQTPGVEPGDVMIVLDEQKHSSFQRKGNNLFAEVEVDLLTALAGGKVALDHLDDRQLIMQILPGEVIAPDSTKAVM